MPWVVDYDNSSEPPNFYIGMLTEWRQRIPESAIRSEISGIFMGGGRAIDEHLLPNRLDLDGPTEELPAYFRSHGGLVLVSQAIKDVITAVDNGRPQFFPIDLLASSGRMDPRPWYGLNVYAEKSSIIRDKSSVKPHFAYKDTWKVAYIDHQTPDRKLNLTPDALKGAHLWHEKGYPRSMLMSDALKEAFQEAGQDFFESWHADILE